MLDTPEDEPVGPEWWEGRWPAGGITSLEDLERWVNAELEEMISLNWTHPKTIGGEFARKIGRQALRNATRYLDRHGRGDHPPQPIADQLEHIEQIEAALGAVLRHIRQGSDGGGAPQTDPETEGKAKASRRSRAVPKRSWLQDDLDEEIRKYKAHRASIYKELVERVREGRPGAIRAATKVFGRNLLVDKLGVKSPAMVTNSKVWQEIAEELKLKKDGVAPRRGRVGLDPALDKKADEEGGSVLDLVVNSETIRLINKWMRKEEAEATIFKLQSGEITDDQARELVKYCRSRNKD